MLGCKKLADGYDSKNLAIAVELDTWFFVESHSKDIWFLRVIG